MTQVLALTKPRLVVTVDPLVPLVATAQEGSGPLLPLVTLSDLPTTAATPFTQFTDNDGSGYDKRETIDPRSRLAVLPLSSGTTGPPKGVMLSHQNLTSAMVQFSDIPRCVCGSGHNRSSGMVHGPAEGDPPLNLVVTKNKYIFGFFGRSY